MRPHYQTYYVVISQSTRVVRYAAKGGKHGSKATGKVAVQGTMVERLGSYINTYLVALLCTYLGR
jgi:hypothetical protein